VAPSGWSPPAAPSTRPSRIGQRDRAVCCSTPPGSTGTEGVVGTPTAWLQTLGHKLTFDCDLRPAAKTTSLVHGRTWGTGSQAHSLHRLWAASPARPTTVMYRRAPHGPRNRCVSGRCSRSTRLSLFYTAPTAIRAFMKSRAARWPDSLRHGQLRIPGTVGERVQPPRKPGFWYREGDRDMPLAESRHAVAARKTRTAVMISPLAAATTHQPGSATLPLPGMPRVSTAKAAASGVDRRGVLAVRRPCGNDAHGSRASRALPARAYWEAHQRPDGSGRVFLPVTAPVVDADGYFSVVNGRSRRRDQRVVATGCVRWR